MDILSCQVEEVCLVESPDVCLPGDQLAVELWDCALPVPHVQGSVRKHADFSAQPLRALCIC